jgi:hypothetical protein
MDRLQLQKMIDANSVVDCTPDIREKKHSRPIRDDVARLLELKHKYSRLSQSNPDQFDKMCVSQCGFLFNNYTDIFNKVKKDEMNLNILSELLDVLKKIEDGKFDQHTGAYEVGKLLKEMYIDSALMKSEKLDSKNGTKTTTTSRPKPKKISWKDYKTNLV